MMLGNPVRFRRLLGWANVETEAEPIIYKRAKAEAEADANHDEASDPNKGWY